MVKACQAISKDRLRVAFIPEVFCPLAEGIIKPDGADGRRHPHVIAPGEKAAECRLVAVLGDLADDLGSERAKTRSSLLTATQPLVASQLLANKSGSAARPGRRAYGLCGNGAVWLDRRARTAALTNFEETKRCR